MTDKPDNHELEACREYYVRIMRALTGLDYIETADISPLPYLEHHARLEGGEFRLRRGTMMCERIGRVRFYGRIRLGYDMDMGLIRDDILETMRNIGFSWRNSWEVEMDDMGDRQMKLMISFHD